MKRTVLVLALATAATLLASGAAWAAAAAFAPAENHPAGDGPRAVAAGDLDGDRQRDLLAANGAAGTVSVLLRRPDGAFRAPRAYAAGGYAADLAAAKDLDGDGDRDLASTDLERDAVSVRLGRGDGTFGVQRRYPAGNTYPGAIESGDVDGDGDDDLLTANGGGYRASRPDLSKGGTVSVLKNRGDGTFRAARNFVAGDVFEPQDLDVGDLDGDGDLDLVVALNYTRAGEGGLSVLLNEGGGSFGAPNRYGAPYWANGVLADDLDGDGDSDVAVSDGVEKTVTVYLGDGDGTLTYRDAHPVGVGAGEPEAVTGADFDGDGDTDVATANAGAINGEAENVSVLENAGDGTLGNPAVLGAGVTPLDVVRARVDADRKPDLVVANAGSDDVSVLRNVTP